MKNLKKTIIKILPFLFFPGVAMADDAYLSTSSGVTTVAEFLVNGATAVGVILFFIGLYGFHGRGQNPNQYTVGFCFSNLIAGTFLLISSQIYAWSVNSMSRTDWATNSSMLSVSDKLSDDISSISGTFLGEYLSDDTFSTLMGLIYLVGLIGFLRGLYLIKEAGQISGGPGQSGGMAPAFWHIVGGCAVMNILQFGCFISWLFGIPYLCAE